MQCSRCRADNPADAKFCDRCGSSLGLGCQSCGAVNPPANKFCGQCGAALDTPGLADSAAPEPYLPRPVATPVPRPSGRSLPGEMKQVTVLFCDIVDSTPLTERLGPEAMRDLVVSFLEASLAEVRRYGGIAPQFSGDGFMALFGAPLAQEDHVQRALLAALAIQRKLGAGADRMHPPVRIGIHTGPVVFGPVGRGLGIDATVIGDTANVGARLQQAAEPGTILLSEATRLLAQDYARVEPVGPLVLKGKAQPIPAFRLLGVSRRHSTLDAAMAVRPTAFVDRGDELSQLNYLLAQAEGGQGRAVGVVAEPGVGKSRLIAEFRRQLPEGRVTWVEGRCLSYGTQFPYLLLLDVLRSNCGISEADPPETIADKIHAGLAEVGMDPEVGGAVLLGLMGMKDPAGAPVSSNPEAIKSRTFEVLRELCIKGSERRPLVLVLEDLHWIDNISEEFIAAAVDDLPATRILLLSTYRPGYCPPWMGQSHGAQIALQPLSRDDSFEVVRSVFSADRLGELLTEEIVAKADGNPFFLEQLALHAKDLRVDLMVPNTIHDVVMARIDRLPDETKQLLQTASVIGREFSRRLLRRVWNGSRSLRNRLRELRRLEFLYERAEPEGIVYGFRHALTQETVYGSLLERHRRACHGAVGRALEKLYTGRAEEIAELLALHFGRSDEPEEAVDYAILAAEKTQRRWANRESLAYFSDALNRLERLPDTESNRLRRIDAVLKQAEVKFALGQQAEQIAALEDIRGIVDEIGDSRRRATWHYWAGFLHSLTGSPSSVAIEHCRKASVIASATGSDELEGFIASCAAQAYVVAGELRAAIEAGDRAVAIFEARGDLWWASRTLWHLAQAAIYLGDWNASLSYCGRALAHGDTLNDLRLKVGGLYRTGSAYILQGDIERGLRYCDEALALGPIPYDVAMAKVFRGYGQIRAARLDSGIADLQEAISWFERSGLFHVRVAPALRLAEGYLLRGDVAAARALIDEVLSTCRSKGFRYVQGLAERLMAECLAAEFPATAMQHIADAQRIFKTADARNDLAKSLMTHAKLCQSRGEIGTARGLLEEAGAIFDALETIDEPARVTAALAALERGSPIRSLGGML
jgi:class 3 adenylate cyclase/tetratricopeptide (TPR) repeat protein/ribosomal protein L40E